MDWLGNLANYKEGYNVSLFHVVCTVTLRIFYSRCDGSLDHWLFAIVHLKAFCYLCTVNVIFLLGKGEQKHKTKKVVKFPNQSTLLTLINHHSSALNKPYILYRGKTVYEMPCDTQDLKDLSAKNRQTKLLSERLMYYNIINLSVSQ